METNFNFNSAVCTSIEQSRKLLSLGLKKETADMVYFFSQSLAQDWTIVPLADGETAKHIQGLEVPAWSLHRLFQIYTNGVISSSWNMAKFNWDDLIDCIEDSIVKGYFNKEYLVDQDTIEEHCKGVLEYLDYIRGEEE